MQTIEEKIKLHQCLHGYADGHQLIQSSVKLPPKADRLLLTLSDMSGPSIVSGFQVYLTGYPVTDTSWYAFAKTWYANEMPRPGCVWTHTLLIETADLARIRDFRVLLELFIRPSKDLNQSSYATPVKLDLLSGQAGPWKPSPFDKSIVISVVEGLYGQPDRPVYLSSETTSEYTDLVIEIWSQQYPKLRRSFLFCTGALSNRKVAGRYFDLQVVPATAVRHIRREVPNGVFIDPKVITTSTDMPQWLGTAVNELLSPGEDTLHSFLLLFGADAPEGRGELPHLLDLYTRIYQMREGETSLTELIKVVSTYYPEAQQGARLKQAILGDVPSTIPPLPKYSEPELLRELATTDHYDAFDAGILRVRERAKDLMSRAPSQAKALISNLLEYKLNRLGEEMILGMSEAVTVNDALDLAAQKYDLLFIFAKYNPALFAAPQVWRESYDRQRELYDLVSPHLKSGEVAVADVIRAMLDAESDVLADEIGRQYGADAVDAALEWFNMSEAPSLPERWEGVLRQQTDAVLRWLSNTKTPHDTTMALLAGFLDPHSSRVLKLGTQIWLSLARSSDQFDERTRIRVMAFLLALSFNNPDAHAPELTAESFQSVHDAAARERLPYPSWRLLMYQAPSHSWWGEWERCERLRRALVDKFIRYGWDAQHFLQALRRPELFMKVLANCSGKGRAGKFIYNVALDVTEGRIQSTKEQRDALSYYL